MKSMTKLLAASVLAAAMTACAAGTTESAKEEKETQNVEAAAQAAPESTSYSIHVKGDDWGCGVDRVIVSLGKTVDAVDADTFVVSEYKLENGIIWTPDLDLSAIEDPFKEVHYDRQVLDAYLCDEQGNPVEGPSAFAALELYISPADGSPLLFDMTTGYNQWSDPYELTISLAEGKTLQAQDEEISTLTITGAPSARTTDADSFTPGTFESSDGYTLPYATWTPEEESTTLFVWLHGLGEGGSAVVDGTDWMIPLLANEVTAYISDAFQEAVGGANILVPQCPTVWMDMIGDPTIMDRDLEVSDGTSAYTESLHELIAQVKEETHSEKVVIAGCSNGGYMTMNLAMNYGDEYTAFVPVCEAVKSKFITDEQIQALAQLPMYFVWAENDMTVPPEPHEVETVKRMREAGAQNLHTSITPDVVDTTGRFTDEDGNPHQYAGHECWIYFHNNECVSEDGIRAWEWIGEQVK